MALAVPFVAPLTVPLVCPLVVPFVPFVPFVVGQAATGDGTIEICGGVGNGKLSRTLPSFLGIESTLSSFGTRTDLGRLDTVLRYSEGFRFVSESGGCMN
uniref:Putative secreted protein n=1 Tax=Ixodes ricinus TaxID=34613 RepID=A0A6B0U5V0_IXORI